MESQNNNNSIMDEVVDIMHIEIRHVCNERGVLPAAGGSSNTLGAIAANANNSEGSTTNARINREHNIEQNIVAFFDLTESEDEAAPQPSISQQFDTSNGLWLGDEDDVFGAPNEPPVLDMVNNANLPKTRSRFRSSSRVFKPNHKSAKKISKMVDSATSTDNTLTASVTYFNCTICMECCLGRRPVTTKCGHIYCELCIKRAIQITHKCPLCGKKLLKRHLIRIYP